jgi:RNA polymerase sigma-70 factor (ECF subfamily)
MELVAARELPQPERRGASHADNLQAIEPWSRFENMLRRHERRLRRLVFAMVGDPHRVDDILQEAFFNAYRRFPTRFESTEREAAWIYRVVHRACLTELRTRRRRPLTVDLEAHVSHLAAAPDRHDADSVLALLAQLPVDLRATVLLVDMLGFDYEAAATILGIPRGTVASRLNAARTRLKNLLESEENR